MPRGVLSRCRTLLACLSLLASAAHAQTSGITGSSGSIESYRPYVTVTQVVTTAGVYPSIGGSGGSGYTGHDLLGLVHTFAGNFAPGGSTLANGPVLTISSNTALYSLMGVTWGGNGTTTFALPNLATRAMVGQGSGPGLSPRTVGAILGSGSTTITASNLPSHVHGQPTTGTTFPAGGDTPFQAMQPELSMIRIIAVDGYYPSTGGGGGGLASIMGRVATFSGTRVPDGWMAAEGQLLPISTYSALYALLGTRFGGDGVTNFALPDLRGRISVGSSVTRPVGQSGGSETRTITTAQMPPHVHSTSQGNTGLSGSGLPVDLRQPYLSLRCLIAIEGIFPSSGGGGGFDSDLPYLGEIIEFASDVVPDGFMPCDGRLLPISTYTALFAVIGTTYGGDGMTNFALPDAQDRVLVGSNGTTFFAGRTGGIDSITLSTTQLAAHAHALVPSAPQAPTIGTATAGDGVAVVSFTANGDGYSPITSYAVTCDPGSVVATGTTSPITVPLASAGTYTCTATATNAYGTSAPSAASNAVSPRASQVITFGNPGAQNFGTSPTLAASSDSGLVVSFTSSTTGVCAITSGGTLTFLAAGTCTINADQPGNAAYLAAPTVTRSFAVNAVVPGAPVIGTATAGATQATVTFTPPASNGGATIVSYTATANPGGFSASGAGSPITVGGLANGTSYTFTVTATNAAGTGAASAASNAVTPKAPQAITFANPGAQSFGTAPTLVATSDSGLTVTFTSSTTAVCTVTSGGTLTFVAAGTCTINADQAGNASYLAATQVTRSFTVSPVVPGAPSIGTATAGSGQATVTFGPPSTNGGSAVTGYTVVSNPGGIATGGSGSPITVGGLANGTTYTFTVTADNAAGTGPSSAASNAVTPRATQSISFTNPGARTYGTALTVSASATSGLAVTFGSATPSVCTVGAANGVVAFATAGTCTLTADQAGDAAFAAATQASVTFSVLQAAQAITFNNPGAQSFGTTPTLSATGGASGNPVTFTSATTGVCTITAGGALTFVTAGTCTINADQAGNTNYSAAAQVSRSFTVIAIVPGAPTIGTATPGAGQATVSFTPPASNGGAAITSYTVTSNPGGFAATGASSPITVTGLANGTAYTFTVTADNSAGTGPASGASNTVTPKVDQVITFANPGAQTFGTTPTLAATSSAGLAVTFSSGTTAVCTITAAGTLTFVAAGTCTIHADQAGDANTAAAARVTQSFTVNRASQAITFGPLSAKTVGDAPFTVSATGGASGSPVVFSSLTLPVCTTGGANGATVAVLAAGTCTIAANQAGNGNYDAAPQVQQGFAVGPGAQVITFSAPANRALGDPAFALTATGGASGNPVTFASTTPAVCTTGGANGATVTLAAVGTCSITASQAGNANYNAATPVTRDFTVMQNGQAITFAPLAARNFGTPPFTVSATGGASGNPVTFSSLTPSICTTGGADGAKVTLVAAGTCTLAADQAGNASYNAAPQVTQSFTVNAVVPGAPTLGTVTPGVRSISVAFTAPAFTGGAAITSYTVTCLPSGSATGTASPLTVAGLTPGTSHSCTVAATNSAGTGAASAAASATPVAGNAFTGPTATGTGDATVSFTGGGASCTFAPAGNGPLESAFFIPVSGHPKSPPVAPPAGVSFREGLLDFVLVGCTPGASITFSVTYPSPLPLATAYWKFGPTPSNATPHWYVLPATISGDTATFTIVDGGLGDDDLTANGTVVDQGGPGTGAPGTAEAIPTLSEWMLMLLAGLLGLAGMRQMQPGRVRR